MKIERMIKMKPQHTSFLIKPPDPGARLRRLPLAALTLIFVSALSLSGCPGSDSSPPDTAPPVFQSAVVIGDTLTITFNENFNFPLPAGLEADFTVRVTPIEGTEPARAVNSVSDGTPGDSMIELTLATAVIGTDGVTVEYTANNSRRITNLSANILASFAAQRIQNNTDDIDGDGVSNTTDVDDDGDGLIEIHDLNMLNNVRNKLNGTAYNDGSSDNSTGCGGLNEITTCSGYELSRDLDFSAADSYADNVINAAWRPTGSNPATATNPGWMPIGDNSDNFTATFEGNGYSISSLYVRVEPASGRAYAGLFGYSGSGAGIRNTGVVAAAVFASSTSASSVFAFARAYAGGLVGINSGGSIHDSYATDSVSASSSASGDAYVGGLVGQNSGNISNSYATGSVSVFASAYAYAGGLVGDNIGGSISNSYATGSVSAFASSDAYAGGLVGDNTGSISNSYATGSVSASSSSSAEAGGLVGQNSGSTRNSYATGSASASASSFADAGGLVGQNNGSTRNSYATGSVSASALFFVDAGGLVGDNSGGSISNSYATGSVSASASASSSFADAGGLVGFNTITGSISNSYATGSASASASSFADAGGLVGQNRGSISNSYATGSVSASSSASGDAYVGGLVGQNSGSISNSYWDRGTVILIKNGDVVSAENQDIGNTGDHPNVTALTSSQMQAIMEATGMTGTFPDLADNGFDLGSASEYPLLEYGGTEGTDCKSSGDADLPVCGNLLPEQAVRMASGFLRFSNTAIGTPSVVDPVFFYDIGSGNTIDISGTGINGTTAGSYAIEDAAGTAPTVSGTTISGLSALIAGDEFYLSATFTKGSDSFTQRYRFKK